MKEYSKCPVCDNSMRKDERCRVCGYCESLDYENYMTLGLIKGEKSTIGKSIEWKKQKDAVKEKQPQVEMAEETKPDKNILKIAIVAVCALVLVGVVAGIFLNSGGSEENTAENTNTETVAEENSSSQGSKVSTNPTDNISTDSKVGDTVIFGSYEQDGDESGTEGIEWIVLDKKDGKLLLISKYILDCQPYNEEYTDVTWETCTLRKWLNDDFLNNAFSSEEQSQIEETEGLNGNNPDYGTDGGNDTENKVFLLSIEGVKKYFDSKAKRVCSTTQYVRSKKQDAYLAEAEKNWWWWLRSAGNRSELAANVDNFGGIDPSGDFVGSEVNGIRPVMWVMP